VNINLVTVDYLVLLLYMLALFVFGFYMSRRSSKSNTDLFLGGRSLRWWQIGFSMFSANAGPMTLIGFSSLGFSHGMVGGNFEWLAWIFLMLLAMVFLPRYLSTGISTMPQFLLIRFGKRSYNFLVIYSLVSILVVWLGGSLYAGGLVISHLFGCSLLEAVLVVAVISTSYTAIGGFKAVVRTGIFQSLLIIVSSITLTCLAFGKAGGIRHLAASVPKDYWKLFRPASDPEYSWVAILAGYPVVAVYYWCADQTIVQKALAAKDIREGQHGALFIAVLKIITPFIFILPGILCFALYKGYTSPDNAYVTLVKRLMPDGLRGLCIAALIAALIDAVSSGLNSFSTVFTLDIVGQFRQLNEVQQRRMGKWLTVLAAFLAVCVSVIFGHSGKSLFELTQGFVSILAPPLAVVFLAGMIWKKVNSVAAESVLYGGGLVCLVAGVCYVLNFPFKGFWPHFLLLSVYLFTGLSAVIVLITLLTGLKKRGTVKPQALRQEEAVKLQALRKEDAVPPSAFQRQAAGRGARGLWIGWGVLALIMILLYILFNLGCRSNGTATDREGGLTEKVFVVNIVPDEQKLKEYLAYHEKVWPEVEAGFRKAGYRKITLYRFKYLLVMTIVVPASADLDKMGKIAEAYDKRCAEWNRIMNGYQRGVPGTGPGATWVEAAPFYHFGNE